MNVKDTIAEEGAKHAVSQINQENLYLSGLSCGLKLERSDSSRREPVFLYQSLMASG